MKFRFKFVILFLFLLTFVICGCSDKKAQALEKEKQKIEEQLTKREETLKEKEKKIEELYKQISELMEEKGRLSRMLTDAGLSTNPKEIEFNECKENLKKISLGLRLYAAEHNNKYPKKLSDISPDPRYLDFVPTCPSASKDTYTNGYKPMKNLKAYKVCCYGHNHASLMIKENNPSFDSVKGLEVERDTTIQATDEFDEAATKNESKNSDETSTDNEEK